MKSVKQYILPETKRIVFDLENVILSGSPDNGGNEDVGYEDWPIGKSGVINTAFDSLS